MTIPVRWCVDFPLAGARLDKPQTPVRGWIAARAGARIGGMWIRSGTQRVPLRRVTRVDVMEAMPGESTAGFQGAIALDAIAAEEGAQLEVEVDGEIVTLPLDVMLDEEAARTFAESKRRKLAGIQALLQCPVCKGHEFSSAAGEILCAECATHFARSPRGYDFLTSDLRALGAIEDTDSISTNAYDPAALQMIAERPDGWILDAGSGLRDEYFANVVNFEIVDYASTDVVGLCERLPFRDGAFDAVFSFAVLEHIRDPFQAAREIVRVLKPGGVLYAAVPFLQPFHAYPNHYYNMTSKGLRNLFPTLVAEIEDVPASGLPIWALVWILRSWTAGLPPEAAASFGDMRVRDLLGDPAAYLSEPFVAALSPKANEELACVNRLVARKPA
jgi:SAM-dependent methyltransferase